MKDAGCDPIGSDMEPDYDEAEAGRTAASTCGNATLLFEVVQCTDPMTSTSTSKQHCVPLLDCVWTAA